MFIPESSSYKLKYLPGDTLYLWTKYVQLNEYETVLYLLLLSQHLTWDCLLISVYLPGFFYQFLQDVLIKLFRYAEQFCEHIIQKPVKTGKYKEINKQSHVKFWLNRIKYGAVSYLLSCTTNKIK